MAANGQVQIAWGDGDHLFNVAVIGQALELEEKCDAGIAAILGRVRLGVWKVNDIRETIRLGLIGGGMKPVEALALTKRYFDGRPFNESVPAAMTILMAALVGVPGDIVGKKTEAEQTETEAPSASSAPPFTEPAPSSAGLPATLTDQPFGNSPPESTPGTEARAETSGPSF